MRRILDFFKRARERINARIAILAVVLVVGGVCVWQGFSHMAATKNKGPTKKVVTGSQAGLPPGGVQTAAATLFENQVGGAGEHQQAGYGAPGASQPQTSPYQANSYGTNSGDGAGLSPYGNDGGYGEMVQPATAPPGAEPPVRSAAADVPNNPYRKSLSDDGSQPPSTSPYAAAESVAVAGESAEPAPATLAPVDDPVAAYGKKFQEGGGVGRPAPSASAPEPSPAAGVSASTAGASPSSAAIAVASDERYPYPAEVSQPPATTAPPAQLRSLTVPAENPGTRPSPLAATSPHPSPLPAGEGAARAAAPTPGERQLEGVQQPAITIEKFAPSEIQVGKPATFEMIVRNAGQVPAQNVLVSDHVPAGTQLVDVKPAPAQGSDGSLVWQLGTMQPGDEVNIALQVMPQQEGEIGSTAHVTFAAQATSRSICTRPQLTIEHTAPPKVLIGEPLMMGITVSNPGTGAATGILIEEDVPDGLSHLAGPQLEYEIGTLRPGESKRLELSLKAEKAGLIENTIVVRGEAGLAATHKVQIEVVAPRLEVEMSGPKKRFLQRPATYTLSIANPGTAAARDVELVAYLPRGMKFVETDSQGQYDAAQHAVFWSLEELPPSKAGSVKLTTLPVEPGEQKLRIEGKAALGLTVLGEQAIQVEQSAELLHTVKDADEVIEVGSETSYEIRVTNTGTKAATNVRVVAILPAEMKGLAGEGPTRAAGDVSKIVFEPLARLNPQEEVIYKVQAQGVAPGDHLIRVQLSSDEWPTPVTREESTRVYLDR